LMFKSASSGKLRGVFVRVTMLLTLCRPDIESYQRVWNGYLSRSSSHNYNTRVSDAISKGSVGANEVRGVSTIYGSLPDDYEHTESTVKAVGLSLLSGFALMLL
jgi:hypothetical protein